MDRHRIADHNVEMARGERLDEHRSLALLAATLAGALALFFCVGHASHAPMEMGATGAIGHGFGVCLLAATLIAPLVLPSLPSWRVTLGAAPPVASSAWFVAAAGVMPARASPAWLQRFRD